MEVGTHKKLNKPTFLYKGIFVIQGSTVEIKEINDDKLKVLWHDKEGNPHILENIQRDELI